MQTYKDLTMNQLKDAISLMADCLYHAISTLGHQSVIMSTEEMYATQIGMNFFSHVIHSDESPEEKLACCNEVIHVLNHEEDEETVYNFMKKYINDNVSDSMIKQCMPHTIGDLKWNMDFVVERLTSL